MELSVSVATQKKSILKTLMCMMSILTTVFCLLSFQGISVSATTTPSDEDYAFALETSEDAANFALYLSGGTSDLNINLEIPDDSEYLFNRVGTDGTSFYFNKTAFERASATNQQEVLGKLYDIINTSNHDSGAYKITTKSRQKILDGMNSRSQTAANLWTTVILNKQSADIGGGVTVLSGFLPYVRLLFGVISIIIFLGFVLSTAIDTAYLMVPLFNEALTGNENIKKVFKTNGSKAPLISNEADQAFKECCKSGETSGKNIMLCYFGKRVMTIIIFVIAVTYLLFGNLGSLITGLMDAVN